jgi:hypothetical protein
MMRPEWKSMEMVSLKLAAAATGTGNAWSAGIDWTRGCGEPLEV